MELRYVIFDLDGTLLDSMPMWHNVGRDFLRERGKNPPDDLRDSIKELSILQTAAYFREHYGLTESDEEMIDGINALVARQYREVVQPKAHVIAFLQALQQRGVSMCIATATDAPVLMPALQRLDMLRYFQFILTCTEAGTDKNRPDLYDMAAARLGAPFRRAVIFEDAPHCARTAKAAGFPLVVVEDASAAADRDELRRLADRYVTSYEGLADTFTYPAR